MAEHLERVRLSDMLAEKLLRGISADDYRSGARLPREADLMEQYGVSRSVVREAIRKLESQGIVSVQQGRGTFVVGDPGETSLRSLYRAWLQEHRDEVFELLEVRETLEVLAIECMLRHGSEQELDAMQAANEHLLDCARRGEFLEAISHDRAFHRHLAHGGKNRVLGVLIDHLCELIHDPLSTLANLPGQIDKSYPEHLSIVEGLRAGDRDGAVRALRHHVARVHRDMLSELERPGDHPAGTVTDREGG